MNRLNIVSVRTCLMYHAASNVEFQPFKRSYSHLTFFNFLFERSEFLIATSQKKNLCVCSTNLGFSVGKKLCVCSTNLGFSMIPGTYYVPDTYVPGISRQKSIRTYVMFRPWTHTSDDRYIYQLSLVLATATAVSFIIRSQMSACYCCT